MTLADVAIGPEVIFIGGLGFAVLGIGVAIIVLVSVMILRSIKKRNNTNKKNDVNK